MIQRIQSVYLLGAFVCNGVLGFVTPLFYQHGQAVYFMHNLTYTGLFSVSNALTLVSVFTYKKRRQQIALNRVNLVVNLILLGLFVQSSLSVSGGAPASEKGIGLLLPVFSIVFLVLANKAIQKDEALVKSVDRLR